MNCSRCKAAIPAQSTFCNHCGAKQFPDEPQNNGGRWVVVVAGAVLATGVLSAVLASGALDGYLDAFDKKPGSNAQVPTSGEAPVSGTPSSSPASGATPKVEVQPSSGKVTPSGSAFTIQLESDPPGATVKDLEGTAIGQTPATVILPATTIVEFSLGGYDDTCRYELSSKLRDQTVKCKFKKKSAANPDSITPENTPSSGPTQKTGAEKVPSKKTPSSGPTNDKPPVKKTPSSGPSR
jgi:hypothetical protein